MKICAVIGSLRKGNSALMVSEAVSCFERDEVEIIDLSSLKLCFCSGCLECDETQKCNINDEMTEKLNIISSADGFIFASPVRWGLISGEMKTFFDRLNPFAVSETLSGKKAILFVVGQTDEGDDVTMSIKSGMKSMEVFCDNSGIDIIDKVKAYGCLSPNDISNTNYLSLCKDAAIKLRESIE